MKILVTGGAGFIGSHVAEAYAKLGHRVWVVDDLSSGKRENVPAGIELYPWDIADPRVAKLLMDERIELINHHAAHMDVRASVSDPLKDAKTNVMGLLSLLEATRKSGVKRFIFASTGGAIYGEQRQFPAKESHPSEPSSPYGVGKLAGEKYLECYHRLLGIVPQILRYANVYGPRQNPHGEAGVIAIFADKMLRPQTPWIHGSGHQTRDFIYIEDIVKANVLALSHVQACLFNVGTGQETDILTIFRHLQTLTGYGGKAQHDKAKEGEQMRSSINSERILEAWGWKPQVPLLEGLEKTAHWFRQTAASHLG